MAVIGQFMTDGSKYTGKIKTLLLDRALEIVPNEKATDRSPDYRVFAGPTEIGAAWAKTSQQNRAYLFLTLDDPSFAVPITASLVESEKDAGVYRLLWDRPKPQA